MPEPLFSQYLSSWFDQGNFLCYLPLAVTLNNISSFAETVPRGADAGGPNKNRDSDKEVLVDTDDSGKGPSTNLALGEHPYEVLRKTVDTAFADFERSGNKKPANSNAQEWKLRKEKKAAKKGLDLQKRGRDWQRSEDHLRRKEQDFMDPIDHLSEDNQELQDRIRELEYALRGEIDAP